LSSDFSWLKGLPATVGDTIFAEEFTAKLSGFNEIGSIPNGATYAQSYTGAVLSNGFGTVDLKLDKNAGTIDFTLKYSDVGTTPPQTGMVSQAHIHFGKSRDSGGILVFFCTNLTFNGTGPMPKACPTKGGTVTGTWMANNVQAITGQNVVAGDFDALEDALKSNTAYANVHTVPVPGATNTALSGGRNPRAGAHRQEGEKEQQDHGN
jgi:hypothetical protein